MLTSRKSKWGIYENSICFRNQLMFSFAVYSYTFSESSQAFANLLRISLGTFISVLGVRICWDSFRRCLFRGLTISYRIHHKCLLGISWYLFYWDSFSDFLKKNSPEIKYDYCWGSQLLRCSSRIFCHFFQNILRIRISTKKWSDNNIKSLQISPELCADHFCDSLQKFPQIIL